MSGETNIEWTEATWNPLTGCTLVSEGCRNCYAAREAGGRLSHLPQYAGLAEKRSGRFVFTGEVRLHEDRLDQPLRWRKPRRIFVNSMSDLFHPSVPDEFIDKVFAVMGLAPRHTFQVLTKRPERMRDYLLGLPWKVRAPARLLDAAITIGEDADVWLGNYLEGWSEPRELDDGNPGDSSVHRWPLPNVWLGTSVEDQATADERIPALLATPAAVRFLSCEPLLGPLDLRHVAVHHPRGGSWLYDTLGGGIYDHHGVNRWSRDLRPALDWVIVGGESGPNARPMHPDWARALRDQCAEAGVPFHFKQWGEWSNERDDSMPAVLLHPDGRSARFGSESGLPIQECNTMFRRGKHRAGRQLDGVVHDGYPGGS